MVTERWPGVRPVDEVGERRREALRPVLGQEAACLADQAARVVVVGARADDLALGEVRQPAGVIGVEVREHDPPHVVGREPERAQLGTDLLLGRDPFAQGEAEVWVPRREVAAVRDMGGLAGVDDDQPLGVLDEPREDRQRLGPSAVHEQARERAAPAAPTVALELLDRHGARLDGVDPHAVLQRYR